MRTPRPLPPPFNAGPFSTRDAREAGIQPGRLKARDLVSPFHGVHESARTTDDRPLDAAARRQHVISLCAAYRHRAREGEFLSHATAAFLHGLPIPLRFATTPLDVGVLTPAFPSQAQGVCGHRISASAPLVRVAGFPVAHAADVWVQLAGLLSVDELVMLGDGAVRRKRPPATLDDLRRALDGARGKRGAGALATALPQIRPGTDSPKETEARLILVRGGLPEPVIGHAVHDTNGDFIGTPDLAYVAERIAIDYDGDDHRTDIRTFRDDIERRELFHDARWRYIRVVQDHLDHPHRLVARVSRALDERRAQLHPP